MIAVWILCGLTALLALILLIKVSARIEWCDGAYLTVGIGFFRITRSLSAPDAEKVEKHKEEHAAKEEKPEKKEGSYEPGLKELIPVIKDTVSALFEKTKRHIKLERCILKINVATEDPALTGVVYGAVCAAAGSLLALATSLRRVTRRKGAVYTEITPNFISDKPDIYVDICFSTRIWRGVAMSIPLLKGYKEYRALKKRRKIKENQK